MTTRVTVLIIAIGVGSLWSVAAADEPASRCPEEAACPHCQACEQETHGPLTALIELRKLFGDPLAGTALEAPACEEDGFADAVARVAEEPEGCRLQFEVHAIHDEDVQPARSVGIGRPNVKTLRQSARQLEAVANDLEDLGLYEKADELRDSAAGLRGLARGEAQARLQVGSAE